MAGRIMAVGGTLLTLIGGAVLAGPPTALAGAALDPHCSQIDERGYELQQNLHASQVLVDCGLAPGGDRHASYGSPTASSASAARFIGTDLNLITGTETLPRVTQSESMAAVNGNDVVVGYNDSRASASSQFSGISVSHDGGTTFTRLGPPSPFASGHGNNFGDPVVVYNRKLATWFAGWLATGCGGQGIGLWTATNPDTWSTGACAISSTGADRESMWVDNNPSSPFYGRMYIAWNDFGAAGALRVTHSDDGATWTPSVTLSGPFLREVQITGGSDGTVFAAALNENGGGVGNGSQQNLMFRSTNGGVTFTSSAQAAIPGTFTIPGNTACSSNAYFPKIQPIWRQTGYGIPGVGPSGVVHYDYAAHGTGADEGDIFYVRSTDNGTSWSAPLRLNTDAAPGREQWMPSLSVTPSGTVVASWYDRRNTTDGVNYQRFIRVSIDNGASWGPDQAATPQIPQPAQPDPNIQACYAGDYNYTAADDTRLFDTWTDGRVAIAPTGPQQDVFVNSIQASSLSPTLSVSASGTGTGKVSGPGIDCPVDCTEKYADGTTVSLTATADAGSALSGFGGACSGATCSVTLNGNQSVSATFTANAPETKIDKAKIKGDKATIKFSATGLSTGFQCALKKPKKPKKAAAAAAKVKFKTCKSPRKYTNLKPGKYKFSVRAVGPGGTDASPAKKRFKIKG